jgi:hypothetical protein
MGLFRLNMGIMHQVYEDTQSGMSFLICPAKPDMVFRILAQSFPPGDVCEKRFHLI